MLTVLVTARARRRKLERRRISVLVTAFAGKLGVAAGQRIVRLSRMIEFGVAPALRIMTRAATRLRAQTAFVANVVMALLTALRRLLIGGRCVAIGARNRDMLAEQRKGRLRMIEAGFSPIAFSVTTFAALSQGAAMRVLLLVA